MAVPVSHKFTHQEESESVYVSMTDLAVSFIFIILILLAFFAAQIQFDESVTKEEYMQLLDKISSSENAIEELKNNLVNLQNQNVSEEREQEIVRLRSQISQLQEILTKIRNSEMSIRIEYSREIERSGRLAKIIKQLMSKIDNLLSEIELLKQHIERMKQMDPLSYYLENLALERTKLLNKIADNIQRKLPWIQVTVVAADGIIRFRSDDMFASGRWRIVKGSTAEKVAQAIGDALTDILPCYTVGKYAKYEENCNQSFVSIETVSIEGHTDSIPLGDNLRQRELMLDNRDLSARRSAETLRAAVDRYRPELWDYLNLHEQPVISFSGYGAMRPISFGNTVRDHASNRRIDIRFILKTPINIQEVEEIRKRLVRNIFHRIPEIVDIVQ